MPATNAGIVARMRADGGHRAVHPRAAADAGEDAGAAADDDRHDRRTERDGQAHREGGGDRLRHRDAGEPRPAEVALVSAPSSQSKYRTRKG